MQIVYAIIYIKFQIFLFLTDYSVKILEKTV